MTRRRRLVFALLSAGLVLVVVEVLSFVVLWATGGAPPSLGRLRAERAVVAGIGPAGAAGPGQAREDGQGVDPWLVRMRERTAVHPYLGYVPDPDRDRSARTRGYDRRSAELGFVRNLHSVVQPDDPNVVVVGVTGGSFARQIAVRGRPELEAGLAALPRFRGREVRVLSLANSGYKQPQQLFAVSWILLLGGHLDLVVNIDGFNEVTLPLKDNVPQGVFPMYPRSWSFRLRGLDPEERYVRGEIAFLEGVRRGTARVFSRFPWRYSMTSSLVWKLLDRIVASRAAAREASLLGRSGEERDYQAHGPSFGFASVDETRNELVRIWRDSSRHLDRLARANGIEYYHFLQPNQYDPGSKPLNPREARVAFDPESPFVSSVAAGYPLLRTGLVELEQEGVQAVDLSMLFSDVDETLYVDDCCHINGHGVGLVADAVVAAVDRASR